VLIACGVELFLAPNTYEAIVRIKVEKVMEIDGLPVGYDPYWIQDQFETIQSKVILFRVITNLNLTHIWAVRLKRSEPLRVEDAYDRLRNQIDVRQTRGAAVIQIKVGSVGPVEAAAIANEIANVYRAHRLEQRMEMAQHSIKNLEAELERRNRELTNKLAEVEALKASSGTNGSQARDLDNLKLVTEKLSARLIHEIQEEVESTQRPSPVDIIDLAEPPLHPRYLQKGASAAALVFGGLGAIVLGMATLRIAAIERIDRRLRITRIKSEEIRAHPRHPR